MYPPYESPRLQPLGSVVYLPEKAPLLKLVVVAHVLVKGETRYRLTEGFLPIGHRFRFDGHDYWYTHGQVVNGQYEVLEPSDIVPLEPRESPG